MGTKTKTNNKKKESDFISPQMLVENIMRLRHDFNMLALSSYALQELALEKELISKDELNAKVQEIYEKSQQQLEEMAKEELNEESEPLEESESDSTVITGN